MIKYDVILVEDNVDDAMLIKRAFKTHNIQANILHLKNGAEACEYIFDKKPFEGCTFTSETRMILLDLNMPKIGGIEVLKKLKADRETNCIPVIILTSSGEDKDIETCYTNGANSYVIKPVEFSNFIQTVGGVGAYWSFINKTC